jgi:glycosyltransferase involved in cell wall biosynthesis
VVALDISIAIATHPPRMGPGGPYERALASAQAQTLAPVAVQVALDVSGAGAAHTRNRALAMVETEWVAFLDSDDELYPDHLKLCARYARLTGVDVVYPGWDGEDLTGMFGKPFDPALLERANYIPVTVLARTEAVRAAGGFQPHPDESGDPCEDWGLWLAICEQGAKFGHLPIRTWRMHPGGTRGRADR